MERESSIMWHRILREPSDIIKNSMANFGYKNEKREDKNRDGIKKMPNRGILRIFRGIDSNGIS